MTDEALRRAVTSAVRNAFRMGGGGGGEAQIARCVAYAEALILPLANVLIDEAVEQAFIQHRQATLRAPGSGAA